MRVAHIVQFVDVGEVGHLEGVTETSRTQILPEIKNKKGNEMSLKTDLNANMKTALSVDYQSVHMGFSVTIKDVEIEDSADYLQMAGQIARECLEESKDDSQELINDLLDSKERLRR